jgi:hypothetical protein
MNDKINNEILNNITDNNSYKHILICTTAINRPILHSDVIHEWYNYIFDALQSNPNKYKAQWFINIDYVQQLQNSVLETEQNLKSIIPEIPIQFTHEQIIPSRPGDFLLACQKLTMAIMSHVRINKLNPDNVIVFWLEDDWKLNPQHIHLHKLIDTYLSNLSVINLSFVRNNYLHALAPCVINYNLFINLHAKAWLYQTTKIDPEHCVGKLSIAQYGPYVDIQNITIINQYKTINATFFNQPMLLYPKSYYTYDSDVNKDKHIIRDNYITPEQVKNISTNTPTFMRVTCSSCIGGCNYGRDFMKNHNITKSRIQTDEHKEFYK